MYAPHVFHGTSGEVTVPESSTARLRTCGARPRLRNSPRNIRAGSTTATYWSPGGDVQADAARVDGEDQLAARSGARRPPAAGAGRGSRRARGSRRTPSPRARATPSSAGSPSRRARRARRSARRRCRSRSPWPSRRRRPRSRSRAVPSSGSSTNASTAGHCVKQARMPANSAEPRIARNGGTFLTVKTTSSASGSRLTAEMSKAPSSAATAASVLTVAGRVGREPEDQEDHEADAERRPGGPEHVADVLPGR